MSFQDAIKQEKIRIKESQGIWSEIQPHDYTGRGFYARQLKGFLDFFPKEQILCLKSESLTHDNTTMFSKIYHFLGLKDDKFVPKPAPIHLSPSVINPKVQKDLRDYFGGEKFAFFMNNIRREEMVDMQDKQKFLQLQNNLKDSKDSIPRDCELLLYGFFQEDLEELKDLVDFDISDWQILSSVATSAGGGGLCSY